MTVTPPSDKPLSPPEPVINLGPGERARASPPAACMLTTLLAWRAHALRRQHGSAEAAARLAAQALETPAGLGTSLPALSKPFPPPDSIPPRPVPYTLPPPP